MEASKPLSREDIRQVQDMKQERVEVPEWGGHVYVRSMRGDERDLWEARTYARAKARQADQEGRARTAQALAQKGQPIPEGLVRSPEDEEAAGVCGMRADLVASCTCDESGALLFTPADIPTLGKKSARALTRVWEVATRLNGIGEAEEKELLQD